MRPLALGLGLLLLACSQQPQSRNITGPDGSPMVHVSCGSDQSACFELAGRSCPTGYKLFPIFDAHDNNYLVRCQAAGMAQADSVIGAPLTGPPPQLSAPNPPAGAPYTALSTQSGPPPLTRATVHDSATDWGY